MSSVSFREQWTEYYSLTFGIVSHEILHQNGIKHFLKRLARGWLLSYSPHLQHEADDFEAIVEEGVTKIEELVFKQCWKSETFREICDQGRSSVLVCTETGDAPEIINICLPQVDTLHDFDRISELAVLPWFELNDLKANMIGMSEKKRTQFCLFDISNSYFCDAAPKLFESIPEYPNDMDLTRMFMDIMIMIGKIRSWRRFSTDTDCQMQVFLSTSQGGRIFGNLVQVNQVNG